MICRTKTSSRGQLKCHGTRAETRFSLSAKRTNPFKSAGASVQSTTGSRGVHISGSNVGYTMFRGSVKGTGYPLHSPVSPSLPLPCVTLCHHISTGVYRRWILKNFAGSKISFVITKNCLVFLCILFNMYDKKELGAKHKAHSFLHNFITTHLSVLLMLF